MSLLAEDCIYPNLSRKESVSVLPAPSTNLYTLPLNGFRLSFFLDHKPFNSTQIYVPQKQGKYQLTENRRIRYYYSTPVNTFAWYVSENKKYHMWVRKLNLDNFNKLTH